MGIYENIRSGDCGPVAMKFMELHANRNPSDSMAFITDNVVDDFRKHYAMDIFFRSWLSLYILIIIRKYECVSEGNRHNMFF